MTERPITLRVVFYFDPSDADRTERLDRAKRVIEPYALTPIIEAERQLKQAVAEVCLVFDTLAATALLHHAFESKLNRDFSRGGCGAAIVERVT